MTFGARALIRLGALKHNLSVIRDASPGSKLMAVIKANAYGHGLLPVARNLPNVDALAVARLPEAMLLREAGIAQPIVLLAGVQADEELQAAVANDLDVVVHCPEQLQMLESSEHGPANVWLKFDTGMNRLGFDADAETAQRLIASLSHSESVRELRLMSHLASADDVGNKATQAQLDAFRAIAEGFDGAISIANSPTALGWNTSRDWPGEQWIRSGIALFGVSPFAGQTGSELGLEPVMKFESRIIAVKPLKKGASVGYQAAYTAPADTTMGVIATGYGDGYTRHFRAGTPVLVNGRKVPLIGNVSMDMITVDLGDSGRDRVGDVVTLWGPGLPVEEVAPWADAIPYELVCGVMNREESEIVV